MESRGRCLWWGSRGQSPLAGFGAEPRPSFRSLDCLGPAPRGRRMVAAYCATVLPQPTEPPPLHASPARPAADASDPLRPRDRARPRPLGAGAGVRLAADPRAGRRAVLFLDDDRAGGGAVAGRPGCRAGAAGDRPPPRRARRAVSAAGLGQRHLVGRAAGKPARGARADRRTGGAAGVAGRARRSGGAGGDAVPRAAGRDRARRRRRLAGPGAGLSAAAAGQHEAGRPRRDEIQSRRRLPGADRLAGAGACRVAAALVGGVRAGARHGRVAGGHAEPGRACRRRRGRGRAAAGLGRATAGGDRACLGHRGVCRDAAGDIAPAGRAAERAGAVPQALRPAPAGDLGRT